MNAAAFEELIEVLRSVRKCDGFDMHFYETHRTHGSNFCIVGWMRELYKKARRDGDPCATRVQSAGDGAIDVTTGVIGYYEVTYGLLRELAHPNNELNAYYSDIEPHHAVYVLRNVMAGVRDALIWSGWQDAPKEMLPRKSVEEILGEDYLSYE